MLATHRRRSCRSSSSWRCCSADGQLQAGAPSRWSSSRSWPVRPPRWPADAGRTTSARLVTAFGADAFCAIRRAAHRRAAEGASSSCSPARGAAHRLPRGCGGARIRASARASRSSRTSITSRELGERAAGAVARARPRHRDAARRRRRRSSRCWRRRWPTAGRDRRALVAAARAGAGGRDPFGASTTCCCSPVAHDACVIMSCCRCS